MLRHYRFIIAVSALRLAQTLSGSGLGHSLSQPNQQQLAAQRDALERQVAAQAEQQRRTQVEAERKKPPFSGTREALEPERRVAAGQVQQLREAEERGSQERRAEAEAERKREAHLREEEWRFALEARQAPPPEAEQSREEQHTAPASEAQPAIPPTGSPSAIQSMFARSPLLRLGLAFFAAATVFILGWMLPPPAVRRRSTRQSPQ